MQFSADRGLKMLNFCLAFCWRREDTTDYSFRLRNFSRNAWVENGRLYWPCSRTQNISLDMLFKFVILTHIACMYMYKLVLKMPLKCFVYKTSCVATVIALRCSFILRTKLKTLPSNYCTAASRDIPEHVRS